MATIKIKSGDQWTQIPMMGINPMPDAPSDGKTYGRKDGAWAEVTSSSGSTQELTKEAIEAVFTGNVETHSHDTVYEYTEFETDVWDGTSISETLSGSGTKEDPYLIQSCADLLHLRNNGSQYNIYGMQNFSQAEEFKPYFKVTKSLDFDNKTIANPTGSSSLEEFVCFMFNIDGQNATISNFNLSIEKAEDPGIFNLAIGGYFHNFNLKNITVSCDASKVSDGSGIGLFGGIYDTMYNTINNTVVNSKIILNGELTETGTTMIMFVTASSGYQLLATNETLLNSINVQSFNFGVDVTIEDNTTKTNGGKVAVISYVFGFPGKETIGYDNSYSTVTNMDVESGDMTFDGTSAYVLGLMYGNTTNFYVNSDKAHGFVYVNDEGKSSFITNQTKTTQEIQSDTFVNELNSLVNIFRKDPDGNAPILAPSNQTVTYDGYAKQSYLNLVSNNVSSNTSRIDTLETNVSSNTSRIDSFETKIDSLEIKIDDGGSGTVTKELQPNTYYEFGVCDQLTITLASGRTGYLNQYMFEFSCSPFSATTLSNIPGVFWQNNEQLIPEAGHKYQVSIINNVASYYKILSAYGIVTYTTTGASENVKLINRQEIVNSITLEDGTDVPITGTGALNYTFTDAGEHKVAIELKEKVSSFYYSFSGCTSLTSIPENLFANCPNVTDFSECFGGCSGLTSIPENLFANCPNDFGHCFKYCSGLTSIPENLFANCPNVTDFEYCFYQCSGLTNIPENLFASNTAATNFEYCFGLCKNLASIPSKLFINNTAVTDFKNCFRGCPGLTSIPENLFTNNTAVTDFGYCFSNCTGLTSIPDSLFANCTNITSFASCFSGCTSLTNIPANLFTNNTKVDSFSSCFYACSGLTSIPNNLFTTNTVVTEFSSCFGSCKNLASIPANLFANNTAVTHFNGCFSYCTSLTSIPENLFSTNTAVTNFGSCFQSCSGLTSIPENLFATNTAVTNFTACFQYCSGLTGNVPVDNDETPIYYRSGEGKSGYEIVTSSDDCFYNCTGLTYYNSIPSDWK